MDIVRITELQPKTYVEQGDYIAIDNQSDGTKKVQFTNLLDDTLSQENKIAPANVVGQRFTNMSASVAQDIADVEADVNALRTAVGSPLKASTVAQMTDTNKIYVYVGSESGYTNGNWYYWNGSAWTSGGVYNSVAVVTDPTLTLSGVPADAKATGDEVTNLKDDLNQTSRFSLLNFECERGNYNNSGVKENSEAINKLRLRTSKAIPVLKGDSITCTSYARYGIVFTDSNLSSYTATSGWQTSADTWVAPSDGYAKVTCLKNDYSEILDSEIDTLRNAIYGYLQCVPRVEFDKLEVMKEEIALNQNGYQYFDASIFQVGGLTNGVITSVTSRVVTTNIISFGRDIIIKANSGWRFGVQTYDANDNYLKDSGWQTKYKITSGTRFRICISKNPDYSINVTGLEKAVSKHVQYSSAVGESVINNEPFDYYYDGEPLDFSRKGFDVTSLASVPTITGKSIQGFAIYGGVLFQLYNTNTVRLIDTSNYSVITELEITSDHGNTIDFSNEFYDVSDEFPLAYITSDSISNPTKVYVVRITRTGTTLIRTYYFGDASIKGYWAGHCLDTETNTLYLVGYTEDHYYLDENGTNNMIVSAWDIDNTTVNQDSTLTPQFIKSFTVPFIRTGQGRRFFNNRIYILSSHNGALSLPTNTNIVVIDPFREKVVSKFDNFPTAIKNSEAEAIEFVLNSKQDGYDMILSDGYYYKLSFRKL